jgi:hypothetical protein
MRNYQTLVIIGGIINILIVLAAGAIMGALTSFHESFGNYTTQYGTQQDVNKFYKDRASMDRGLQYVTVAIPVSVFASIAAMVLVFVIKDRFKALGIILIVLGVIIVISTSGFGIVGFAMFIVAGIVAIRYKPKPAPAAITT